MDHGIVLLRGAQKLPSPPPNGPDLSKEQGEDFAVLEVVAPTPPPDGEEGWLAPSHPACTRNSESTILKSAAGLNQSK
jgi:hypothetical protein